MKKTIIIFFLVASLVLVGCTVKDKKEESDSSTQETTKEEQAPLEESQEAKDTVIIFFDHLHDGEFDKAVELYQPEDGTPNSWEGYEAYSQSEDKSNHATLLEDYCNLVQTCHRVNVLEDKKTAEGQYTLTVQFIKDDGEIFVLKPCCDETEETMPSQDKFDYKVKKIDGKFKVTTAPIYKP